MLNIYFLEKIGPCYLAVLFFYSPRSSIFFTGFVFVIQRWDSLITSLNNKYEVFFSRVHT